MNSMTSSNIWIKHEHIYITRLEIIEKSRDLFNTKIEMVFFKYLYCLFSTFFNYLDKKNEHATRLEIIEECRDLLIQRKKLFRPLFKKTSTFFNYNSLMIALQV